MNDTENNIFESPEPSHHENVAQAVSSEPGQSPRAWQVLLEKFTNDAAVKRGAQRFAQRTVVHVTRSGPASQARLAAELIKRGGFPVIIGATPSDLVELRALLSLFLPSGDAQQEDRHTQKKLQLPPEKPSWLTAPAFFAPARGKQKRRSVQAEYMASLYALHMGSAACALITPEALLYKTPPRSLFESRSLELRKGMDMPPDLIMEQLVEWGYRRVPMVAEYGEFSSRGDILDIFAPGFSRPVRFEFFGDSIEDLRLFDPASQRSNSAVEEMTLIPARAVVPEQGLREEAVKRWKSQSQEHRLEENDLYSLRKALESGGEDIYPGMFYENAAALAGWLPARSVILAPGETDLTTLFTDAQQEARAALLPADSGESAEHEERLRQPPSLVLFPEEDPVRWIQEHDRAYFEELKVGVESVGLDLPERAVYGFQELFPHPSALERPWAALVHSMKEEWGRKGDQAILCFTHERSRAKFLALAAQDGVSPKLRYEPDRSGLYALIAPVPRGYRLLWDNTLILGESMLQPRAEKAQRPASEAFKGLDRYDELQEGDLLVHRDYGICAFGGLQRLQLGSVANDFLLLRYAGQDKLYLPVDRLGLIQVFKSPDDSRPVLDKLGGPSWSSSKAKAKKAIEKIASDLVDMYAYRKVAKGFTYGPENEIYREFEATFGFEETPDQAKAIADVLSDMEKPEPMDRLVCGDVGFGKTEVAMRASFRAALEGRQVALLCPTTVLAEQHYQTFRARLSGFPVNVGLLSRFVSKAKQKEVLEGLQRGEIDIVIGTHRLLSKDVIIPKLGLIVLDEEQRFGVRHKERLKEIRKNVDVLTLTATPIPRTLQLSLSGIRELSVIETPPPERKPVSTALINRDDAALRSVLQRELERQGQVFWVYNRVQGLERAAEYVKKLVPEARIGMAHGQMGEKALEEAMRQFWHGELDVLVCTAIVESGLDFPRANTLIVDQAQLFGLGQLYQLRGRVGRSDRQAFAVFVCPDVDRLPENTRKRMRIILEMDYLGAGFQVAMEDLRLRGAGNILGESQSGHMTRLGLDLFLEMLEEAVAKMRGQPLREALETELSLAVPAHIPENYISDSRERLRYYKALSSAQDEAAQRDVEFELRDRFGTPPPELDNFFSVLDFKRTLARWGVGKADIAENRIKMHFSEQHANLDPAALVSWVAASKGRAAIHPPATLEYKLEGETLGQKLAAATDALGLLLESRRPAGA